MQTKDGFVFPKDTQERYKVLLINMIYKLLPLREEGKDWKTYLQGCILEIQGFDDVFEEIDGLCLARVLSKLKSLENLTEEEDFYQYRKTIFECTNLID